MEIWKDIPNYENQYQASNLGNIKSLDRKIWNYNKKGRILKQNSNRNNYQYVSLNGKKYYVHILVAKTFIENPNNYEQINHKDFNKQNNCVENLEWVSREQNINHYKKSIYFKQVQLQQEKKLQNKTFKKIIKYRNDILNYYYVKCLSIEEIAKICNIGRDFVSNVIELYKGFKKDDI